MRLRVRHARLRRRAIVALGATALTSVAVVTTTATPASASTRVQAESATLGTGTCGDGQAQSVYTLGTGETVVFNGGDGCTMTFNASAQTSVERIRWFGGGSASSICGFFKVVQGGAEKARTASTCSVGGASPTDWQTPTFPSHTLTSGSYQIVWDADAGWQDAHVDWIDVASSTTRMEAENSTLGTGTCGDGQAQSVYTLGTGETVVFNGGDGCTMTFNASGQTAVQRIRWFGGGSASSICGFFKVVQGGAEKARTASTCSVGGASPTDWQTPTFPSHTLASGSFQVVWDADAGWQDAHVDWIETGGGSTPTCGSPTASLTPSSQTGTAPYAASFSLSGAAASGCTISSYSFAYGDGTTDTGTGTPPSSATHTYTSPGTYTATLTVTQNDGKTGSASVTVNATDPAPTNDHFGNAVTAPQTLPYRHVVSTAFATRQSGEPQPCASIGSTVWYKWTAPVTQTVEADLYGSSYNTALAVYTGSGLSSLSLVGCNDGSDDVAGGPAAAVSWTASAGTTYYVQVGGKSGATGTADFDIKAFTGPANDNFAGATDVSTLPVFRNDPTRFASSQPGEPTACGGGGTTVWYRYTHPSTRAARRVFVSTFGASFNTTVAVWRGTSLTGLTAVTCNNDSRGTLQSQASWLASPGVTYYVQATGVANATGNLTFRVKEGALLALGDSVVAGHGIGANPNGYPGNPTGAYSQTAGNDLGLNVYNFAKTGSCADNNNFASSTDPRRLTPESCDDRSVVADQLNSWASAIPTVPTHVVVGVGGNDIEFAACIDGYMSWNGTSDDANKAKVDLCKTPKLTERLSALDANLRSILDTVKSWSSPAPYITVMGYYNPFSDAPSDPNQVCDMWMPAAISRNNNLAADDHNGLSFRTSVLATQADAYAFSNSVVTALNDTLRTAAQAKGATFVATAPSFVGHDICRTLRDDVTTGGFGDPAQTWVYGPDWTDEFDHPFMLPRRYDSRRMPADCAYPNRGDEERYIDGSGLTYDYELWFRPNCLAHPTPSGHVAMSGLLKPSLPIT